MPSLLRLLFVVRLPRNDSQATRIATRWTGADVLIVPKVRRPNLGQQLAFLLETAPRVLLLYTISKEDALTLTVLQSFSHRGKTAVHLLLPLLRDLVRQSLARQRRDYVLVRQQLHLVQH